MRCSTVTDSGIGKENFDFRGVKISGQSAKKSINWHTGWLGEKDANGDLVGDWAGHIMLTRSSSGVGIAMWRGSTLMVEEPV